MSSDKTEKPTPKKLRDARKKGQVAKSKEVSSAALIATVFGLLLALMPSFLRQIGEMIAAPAAFYQMEFGMAANAVLELTLITAAKVLIPIVGAVVVVGVGANLAQVGLLAAPESIKPDLKKLNPASAVKRIFSLKNLVEFLKSIVKIAFLSVLLVIVIRDSLQDLVRIPHCGVGCIPAVLASIFFHVIVYTIVAFAIIAAADFVFQKWQFMKEQKMSKDEVKREYKESEGDPHIKGKRKQLHRELMQSNMEEGVKRAKVVVTNPIHFAVALDYRRGETPLPIVVGKGQNIIAKRIVQIAQEQGIPVMQNVPLARGLYADAELGQYIPVQFIDEVAEVMRWVYELEEQRSEGEQPAEQ